MYCSSYELSDSVPCMDTCRWIVSNLLCLRPVNQCGCMRATDGGCWQDWDSRCSPPVWRQKEPTSCRGPALTASPRSSLTSQMKRASPPRVTSWRADCRQAQVRPTSQVVSVLYCVCSLYQFGLPADTGQTHQSVSQCFILRLFIIPVWIAGRHRSDPPVSQSVFYIASVHYTSLDCRQTQARPTSQSVSQCFILHLFIIPSWIAGRYRSDLPVSQSVFYIVSVRYTKLDCRQAQVRTTSQSVFYIASVHYTKFDCRQAQVRPTSQSISVFYCVCSLLFSIMAFKVRGTVIFWKASVAQYLRLSSAL